MKKYLYILLLLTNIVRAQNFVPNNSFDLIANCPPAFGCINWASPWFQPCVWSGNVTNSASSELYDTCSTASNVGVPINQFGNQIDATGIGYAGIMVYVDTMNYREYLEVPLDSQLVAGRHYCVEFYVSLAEVSYNAISNFGAYFSADSLLSAWYYTAVDSVSPQIENITTNMLSSKTSWMLVSGNFIASGGEKFMTIGNFHKPINTNTQPVAGGSLYPGMAYYYVDNVSVVDCMDEGVGELGIGNEELGIYPNPASTDLAIELKTKPKQKTTIEIKDVLGQTIDTEILETTSRTIDVSRYQSGVYFIQVQWQDGILRKKFVKD